MDVAQVDFGDEGVMRLTAVEGKVKNGQVRVLADVRLPENAKVYVVIPGVEERAVPYIGSPRLAHPEQVADFEKEVIEEGPNADL